MEKLIYMKNAINLLEYTTERKYHMITKENICSICYDHIIPNWYSTSEIFPDFLKPFTLEEKAANEAFLSSLIPELS